MYLLTFGKQYICESNFSLFENETDKLDSDEEETENEPAIKFVQDNVNITSHP